jgi:hypothetical protein
MSGGELALAVISGGLGFVVADFIDRYMATYNPSTTTTAPANMFYGGTGTEANTLNLAMPPSITRIGIGAGVTLVLGLGAHVVKNGMGKAALQGATIGAAISLFRLVWNSYVMGKVLMPKATDQATLQASMGARLYPAEITAAQNLANSPQTLASPSGLQPGLAAPPQLPQGRLGDVGPFANAPPQGVPVLQPNGAPPAAAPPPVNAAPQPAPRKVEEDCGCLGDRMPKYLGFVQAAA